MKFALVGEEVTDYYVIRNILAGLIDKNIGLNPLHPEDTKKPGGKNNVLDYIKSEKFKKSFEFNEYIIIQIDTRECDQWPKPLKSIGTDETQIATFIQAVINYLIDLIGESFYTEYKDRILFAITVHELECWLLPFNSDQEAIYSKMVTCSTALEQIASRQGFSIHQKNYQEGKHFDDFSKDMRKRKTLLEKSELNPSLKIFVDTLKAKFPPQSATSDTPQS